MNDNSNYLNTMLYALTEKKEIDIDFEFPKRWGGWDDFTTKTEIGRNIAQNDYLTYADAYHGPEIKGAFIKLDDLTYAQIFLLGSEKSEKTTVHIEIFKLNELKGRVNVFYNHPDKQIDKTKIEQVIQNLNYYNIEEKISKSR